MVVVVVLGTLVKETAVAGLATGAMCGWLLLAVAVNEGSWGEVVVDEELLEVAEDLDGETYCFMISPSVRSFGS